jgi:hypothetical protein
MGNNQVNRGGARQEHPVPGYEASTGQTASNGSCPIHEVASACPRFVGVKEESVWLFGESRGTGTRNRAGVRKP